MCMVQSSDGGNFAWMLFRIEKRNRWKSVPPSPQKAADPIDGLVRSTAGKLQKKIT